MKRKNLLIAGLLFTVMLLTSCGGPTATPVATSVPATALPASTNTPTVPATSTSTAAPTATSAPTVTSAPTATSTLAPSALSCPAGTYYGSGTNQCIAVQIPNLANCELTVNICAHRLGRIGIRERFNPATCTCHP